MRRTFASRKRNTILIISIVLFVLIVLATLSSAGLSYTTRNVRRVSGFVQVAIDEVIGMFVQPEWAR